MSYLKSLKKITFIDNVFSFFFFFLSNNKKKMNIMPNIFFNKNCIILMTFCPIYNLWMATSPWHVFTLKLLNNIKRTF